MTSLAGALKTKQSNKTYTKQKHTQSNKTYTICRTLGFILTVQNLLWMTEEKLFHSHFGSSLWSDTSETTSIALYTCLNGYFFLTFISTMEKVLFPISVQSL